MKKLLSTILLTIITISTWANDFEVDGIYYYIMSSTDKTVCVTYKNNKNNSYSGSIDIPSSINYNGITYSVTAIGSNAFYGCTDLTSITIPNSVTSISLYAFKWCTSLTSITIPNSVKSIDDEAFRECTGLITVTIGNSVKIIEYDAFCGCYNLSSITIGNSVTEIGSNAFNNCNRLREIHSNNATPPTVGANAFTNVKTTQCKLYVPIGSKDDYAFASGWSDFVNIIEEEVKNTDGSPCATPTISIVNGKIAFACETPGAKCHYSIKANTNDVTCEIDNNGQLDLNPVTAYTIECYASADGYADSETVTKTITIEKADVNADGKVDVNDVNVVISNIFTKP